MSRMTAQELYDKELAELREIWEAGHLIGLFDAVRYCATVNLPLPEWANLGVLNIIQHHHHAGVGDEGAHGSPKGRFAMDYAHYLRWRAVRSVLLMNGLTALPTGRGRPPAGAPTAKELLQQALRFLENQKEARLGHEPREIQKSFRLVENSREAGEARFKFENLFTPP